jgi:hypothetical protein
MRRIVCIGVAALLAGACVEDSGGTGGTGGTGGAAPTEPYTVTAFDRTKISSLAQDENFQYARTSIDFGPGPFESATLVVELESPCYPFSKWREPGAIPPGHNWPADCDAFDRTFTFQLLPRKEGEPKLELVRAITPFGGPMEFSVDVTDVANGLPGQHELEVHIGAWPDGEGRVSGAKGSWFVSARLEMVPGEPPRKVRAVIPLFFENWSGPGTDLRFSYDLEIPEGTRKGKIEYRATGHGGGAPISGCIGPAEEFCSRIHEVWVRDRVVATLEPWRTCDDNCTVVSDDPDAPFAYCAENPCANHDSARAPRANWCPGQLTPPIVVEHPFLNIPGPQTVAWNVNRMGEGIWTVSGVYFAYE